MAITQILKMHSLGASLNYCMKDEKTNNGEYIHTFGCSSTTAREDFLGVTAHRLSINSRKFSNRQYMIIQSFPAGETNYETAFEISRKLAEKYLGKEHQYVVTTHVDTDHINSHIIFNATSFKSYKSFDGRGGKDVNRLRTISDGLCKEYGLSIIENPRGKGISQKEYYARKHNRSFKAQLEKAIDTTIKNSSTYEEFLANIKNAKIEIRAGNYLSMKLPNAQKFIRCKTLGIDYSEASIKFRIENPDFEISRPIRFSKLIDTSDSKFQENYGLSQWAKKQNIKTLSNVAATLTEEKSTSAEFIENTRNLMSEIKQTGKLIDSLDEKILDLQNTIISHKVFKDSMPLILDFKKLKNKEDKATYKRKNFSKFKVYDKAKRDINKYLGSDNKPLSPDTLKKHLEELKVERAIKYTEYQEIKKTALERSSKAKIIEDLSIIKQNR